MEIEELNDVMVGYSRFELLHFILGQDQDPRRMLRQIKLEKNARLDSIKRYDIDIKRKDIKIEDIKNEIAKLSKDPDANKRRIELLKLDIEELELDKKSLIDSRNNSKRELEQIEELYKNRVKPLLTEEMIDKIKNMSEDELYEYEKDYWVNRMAKQAALSIIATGRIDTGNMDVILQLPKDTFSKTLEGIYNNLENIQRPINNYLVGNSVSE